MVSATVMILNETVLGVALPIISADFQVEPTIVQWLTTGFILLMAIVIPMTGFLIQRFSTRSIFVAAVVLFSIGTVIAAIAPLFGVLLIARMIQAVGTAIMFPLLMTVAISTVPPEKRGATMGLIGVVISLAPALGPTVSGLILSQLTWHWLFWTVLPIILFCLFAGIAFLTNVSEQQAQPLDIPSVPLSALGFGGIVYGLSYMGNTIEHGDTNPVIALAIGIISLILFLLRQHKLSKRDAALLDLRPFQYRPFRIGALAITFSMAVLLGTVIVLPFYLQQSLGVSALQTGLLVLPGGFLQGIASPIIGRLYDKYGPRLLALTGGICLTLGQIGLAFQGADARVAIILALHMLITLGFSLLITPFMTDSLAEIPPNLYSHASAIISTLQQVGGAVGTALFIATMSIATNASLANQNTPAVAAAHGSSAAFTVGIVLALAALVTAWYSSKHAASPSNT